MKLVVTEYISLDGVIEDPMWIGPYFDDDFLKFKFDELFAADALLMGRATYDYFAPVWVTDMPVEDAPGQEGFAERTENIPKHIVTTTLASVPWNNARLIRENIVPSIANLRQQPGRDLLVAGSGTLVQTLMQHNLVDEYRFLVYPVIVGKGQRFFQSSNTANLSLIESKSFNTGVVSLIYHPQS